MSADAWSALGTWVGAGATVITLWYMKSQIVQQNKQIEEDKKQYETDRNERLKKDELDKEYDRLLKIIDYCNKTQSDYEMHSETVKWLETHFEHGDLYDSLKTIYNYYENGIDNFKEKDQIRGMSLSYAFASSILYDAIKGKK